MKKKLTRILAIALIAMMLIPTVSVLAVSANDETEPAPVEINNLYDPKTAVKNAIPSMETKDQTTEKAGEMASAPIAVTKGQYVYVGPCPAPTESNAQKLNWMMAWYKKDGAYAGVKQFTSFGPENVIDTFDDGSVIYKVLVNGNSYKYAALRTSAKYLDYVVMTVNEPFTKEDYYAYADAQGWDIESAGLRPIPPKFAPEAPEGYEGIWNLFPREGERDPMLRQHQNNEYVMSEYIPVQEGDVITMGAISTAETRSILYTYDAEFKEVRNYKRTDYGIDHKEPLGYSFSTYAHTVQEGVAYVKVCVHSGVYNDGDILVTRNQPFTRDELRATLEIDELSDEAKAHPFYNKKALFVGDSISYGSYDTPPTYRNPSASWARRLALATGLIPTNLSYPGASIGKTGLSNVKWEYDLLNTAFLQQTTYDMIIFQGGVNDARQNVAVGEAMPIDTDRKILVENDRVATFAGGLQLMFKDAKDRWPNAEIYYIANFKLVPDSVNNKDMSEYYAQAKILCAEYGVHYIDLYNDVELYETFDYESEEILPDLIHPTSASYDLLFPTVLRLFNATLTADDDNNQEQPPVDPTPNTPSTTPTEEPQGLSTGAIVGIAVGATAVVAIGGFALYWFVIKKKTLAMLFKKK